MKATTYVELHHNPDRSCDVNLVTLHPEGRASLSVIERTISEPLARSDAVRLAKFYRCEVKETP